MNKFRSGIAVAAFFIMIITLSVVIMKQNKEQDSIEVMNTVGNGANEEEILDFSQFYPIDSSETVRYNHDIDFESPFLESSSASGNVTENGSEEHNAAASPDGGTVTEVPAEAVTSVTTTSRTVITSRQRKDYDSNSVYLDMENILQNPELPVGCEITALTILLRHYGFDAEKTDMAKNYLPTSWGNPRDEDGKRYKDSFYDYFIGDPFSRGYGCFSPAIEKAANKYISAHGGGYTVKNISGCHPDVLYEYLIKGTPVLCWATDGMIEPEYYETWYDNATGEQLDWYLNEHCFVLAGFNIKNSTVTLNDPMKGIIDYNIDKFEVRFKQMHSQALVIIPDGTAEQPAVTEVTKQTEDTQTAQTSVSETVSESETVTAVTEETSPADTSSQSRDDGMDTDFFTGEFDWNE